MTTNHSAPTPQLRDFVKAIDRGRPAVVEVLWIVLSAFFVASFVPGSRHRVFLLRLFGASIGAGVVVKPGVKVKFPWRLTISDHSWIGEGAWIDNLAPVTIGRNVCLSQGSYLCTGNHDWSSPTFSLRTGSITLEDGAWVAAKAVVGPGVTVGRNAVVSLSAVATADIAPGSILMAAAVTSEHIRSVSKETPE